MDSKNKKSFLPFEIGNSHIWVGKKLPIFILGPCVIEDKKSLFDTAKRIREITADLGISFIFKSSYQKANRTSGSSYRGVSVDSGCKLLAEIGQVIQVPVTTDVHTIEDIQIAKHCIDIIQIPAFLCRQTDLIEAAAVSGKPINIKKGQFLAPWDVIAIAKKITHVGCHHFLFTERGTSFGYNNLVVDMRSLYWIREAGFPVVFDATHSVQRPGGGGNYTTGDGHLAPVLARAAVATGVDGIFLETHENPSLALSDASNQIPLDNLHRLLKSLLAIHAISIDENQ